MLQLAAQVARRTAFGSVIPTALTIDRCPVASADGTDALWTGDEPVPGLPARFKDGVVAAPYAGGELVGTEVFPEVFHRVQFRRIGRQRQHDDIARQLQARPRLV